ncbi:MAG: SMC-Scp complex subunit ScpB [Spirochaetes bacterium]|nr:SMC-Scp complex subunit ScpB [Spirochaetota bacterium]
MEENKEINEKIEQDEAADSGEINDVPVIPEDEEIDDADVDLKDVFEAILFLSTEPLHISFFVKNFNIELTNAKIILDSLIDEYEERDGGIKLVEISNGFQFITNAKCGKSVRKILGFKRKEPLTKGMLETLSIIAYKQPIVIAEIEELRGVSSRMMVASLMKRNLVKPVGRKDLPGRPLAYGTTDEFLRFFGLNKLTDLPKLSEIKEYSYEEDQ